MNGAENKRSVVGVVPASRREAFFRSYAAAIGSDATTEAKLNHRLVAGWIFVDFGHEALTALHCDASSHIFAL